VTYVTFFSYFINWKNIEIIDIIVNGVIINIVVNIEKEGSDKND
jgi:hypothetical protein